MNSEILQALIQEIRKEADVLESSGEHAISDYACTVADDLCVRYQQSEA